MRATRTADFLILAAVAVALVGCGGSSITATPDENENEPEPEARVAALVEDFTHDANLDVTASNADWGANESSFLENAPTTSRHAYAYSYPETWNGTSSGRGQYVEFTDPLTGVDLAASSPYPPSAQGRRVQWAFSDTVLGGPGFITSVAWGPVENQTVAATYPNVRLRMGYQRPGPISLEAALGGNYEGAPVVVYDGAYSVGAMADVGNTAGHPVTDHEGNYQQSAPCTGAQGAPGGHNAGLFAYTGWYAWPALTTPFAWDPGDPSIPNDHRLIFDASVQAGDFTQRIRGWFAMTFPCSGLLIAGRPETRVFTTYESDGAYPTTDYQAGVVNPEPSAVDMCFTLTELVSVGQSLFLEGAFGDDTDYGAPALLPPQQPGHAVVALQFQGADAVAADRRTVDESAPFTDWVSDIDACDGMRYIRFRFIMTPDPVSLGAARVDRISIPMTDSST